MKRENIKNGESDGMWENFTVCLKTTLATVDGSWKTRTYLVSIRLLNLCNNRAH